MSKDVVIAGVIVAACLGLVTVAFVVPKQKTVTPEIAKNDDPIVPSTPALDPIGPSTPGNDPFVAKNDPFPPIPEPTNPFTKPPGNSTYPPIGNPPTGPGFSQFPTPIQPITPVEPPPALPTVSEAKTHVVGTGETLGEISAKYYGTAKNWKKIAEANKVDPSDLKVGQKLTIPAADPVVAVNPTTPDLASGERTYTIQKNDSYYSIAKKELGNAARWKELEKLNGIASEDLRIGKVIKLPAKAAAVEPLSPAPEAPSATDPNTHVVKSGETLSDISKQHYGTTTKWKEIIKANPGIDPEGLKVGQKLKIPEIAGTTPSPTSSTGGTSAPADNPAATYSVKAGEYLEDIAQSQLGSRGAWKKIVDANPGIDPKKLRVGQKLVIPGKSAPAEPAPAPKPSTFDSQPSGFGSQPSGFGSQPSSFGSQPSSSSSFGTQPSGFGSQPSSFGTSPSSSGSQPPTSGFPTQPASSSSSFGTPPSSSGSSYPAPVGTPPPGPGSTPPSDNPFGLPPSSPSSPSTGTRPVP